VELIRFGTRTPVTLPYRISEDFLTKLKPYHPIWINTHFNSILELSYEAQVSLNILADHGFPVGNQTVLLKGVNDTFEQMMSLCNQLIKNRTRPYYVFHPHLIEGSEYLRPSVDVGLSIFKKMRGRISGFGIPTYIIDTPSGKVPIAHNYILGKDGKDLILEDVHGNIWREKYVLEGP
jgi:lysine 2,3-aminomutase